MAEQLPDTYYRTPFKFNGKELDEETGLYYYGARYYDPKISIWLSVDPLAESYPNWNPYNYTMQNPINLVDPTGMSSEDPTDPPKKNPRKAESKPENMSEAESLSHVIEIDGNKYHKYTSNLLTQTGNYFNELFGGDDDYFIEHKPYDKADDAFIHEAFETGAMFLAGGVMTKAFGKAFSLIKFNPVASISSKILQVAEKMGIKSAQRGINPQVVEKYYQQMIDGSYKSTGGAGFIHNGKIILTEANHRMNAAIRYGIEKGNFKYADELISKGNFTTANPASYGYKIYNLPIK